MPYPLLAMSFSLSIVEPKNPPVLSKSFSLTVDHINKITKFLPCLVIVCSDILPRHQFLLRCLSSYQLYSATGFPFDHFATHNATDDGEPSKSENKILEKYLCCAC